MSLDRFVELYLSYRNDFLSVEAFAEYYGLSLMDANTIVRAGRMIGQIEL
jgi:hypothetical protein